MAAPDPERLRVWREFLTSHAAMEKMLTRSLEKDHGLQLPWYEILEALSSADEASLRFNELAETVMVNPSSLSRQIDKLEKLGLVVREKATVDDGRALLVVLTREGRQRWRRASTTYYRIVRRVFTTSLTDEDVSALNRIFGKVLEAD